MIKPWKILGRKTAGLCRATPFIEVSVETVELPDGRIVPDYHHLDAGEFVTILAETTAGTFLTLRQYRHGVRRIGLAFPGGRVDDNEAPLAAAQRELLEETGFAGRILALLVALVHELQLWLFRQPLFSRDRRATGSGAHAR